MVKDRRKHSDKTPVGQGRRNNARQPNKISASAPYDFSGKNLTPYGKLLPVITMLEKLGFRALLNETLTSRDGVRGVRGSSGTEPEFHGRAEGPLWWDRDFRGRMPIQAPPRPSELRA